MADFDSIVIGSGAGGLTAALALAQAGQRVLVLEQHYVPGGWCHSFQLGDYRFSPGVHYLGELGPGGRLREIYEGLGVSRDLTFLELNPDGFDHVLIGDERFDIPKGRDVYADRLKARFPHEARGIDGYFDKVETVSGELGAGLQASSALDLLALPFRMPTTIRHGLRSLDSVLSDHVQDPLLRAILSIQAGDHGLGPNQAPFAMHAAVTGHYFNGGWYPMGGAHTLPRAFVRALKRAGGEIRLSSPVDRILTRREGRKQNAFGVRLTDGTEITAQRVISNADPGITFQQMVGPENISRRLKARLARTRWSISCVSLFGALDLDVRALGYDSGNYWFNRDTDLNGAYAMAHDPKGLEMEEFPGLFLTLTTLKDPTKEKSGHHTFEAFGFISSDAFRGWSNSTFGERPEDYEEMKKVVSGRMLRGLERILPGIGNHLVFQNLATPLTNRHYVPSTHASIYGTEKSRGQLGPFSYDVATEIRNLWLCGASTLGHGVMGATASGLVAAARILKTRPGALLNQSGPSLPTYAADLPDTWPQKLQKKVGSPLTGSPV